MTSKQAREFFKVQDKYNQAQGIVTSEVKENNYNLRLYFYRLRLANIDLDTCLDLCCNKFYFPNRQTVKPIVNDLIETLDNFDLLIESNPD